MIHELLIVVAVTAVLVVVWRQRRVRFVNELGIEGDL